MTTLLWIIGLAGGWALLALAVNVPRERRIRQLAASRAGSDSFDAFRQSLPEVPNDIARAVYEGVQGLVAADFPVRATDGLLDTLEVDQGSLDDLIEELCGQPNRGVVGTHEPHEPVHSITTVADLARAIWRVRRLADEDDQSQPAP